MGQFSRVGSDAKAEPVFPDLTACGTISSSHTVAGGCGGTTMGQIVAGAGFHHGALAAAAIPAWLSETTSERINRWRASIATTGIVRFVPATSAKEHLIDFRFHLSSAGACC